MKITFIADCHLNKSSYKDDESFMFTTLPFRSQDFMDSLKNIIEKNINEIKPDLIVFAGDIYDTFDPNNSVMGFFYEQLKKLSDLSIPVIIMVGNHDICSRHHALYPLLKLDLKNIKIVDTPKLIKFKNIVLEIFPHSLSVERKEITMKDQFYKFIEESKNRISKENLTGKKVFFVGHFGVFGANINKYSVDGKEKSVINRNVNNISLDDLDTISADYIVLGDYHRHQTLNVKNGFAMYTGSIERTDMSEANDEKGFIVYDDSNETVEKYGKCRFIKCENIRPMVEIVGNLVEINKKIDELDKKSTNAIVKITVNGNKQQIAEFDTVQYEVLKRLKEKINPIYIKKINNIISENIKTPEELSIIKDIDNINLEEEVINVIRDSISDRVEDELEKKILFDMAENIYKKSKSN